jgi:outer membrane protein assembly factor BamE (lipoprotein component of BamABCDE complex)
VTSGAGHLASGRRRRTTLASAALCLLLVACGDGSDAMAFDQGAWVSAGPVDITGPSVRGQMVRDLEQRHLRFGMPRAEVLFLLGRPDQPPTATEVVYYLGEMESMFMPRVSFLVIYFEDDRIVSVRIAED